METSVLIQGFVNALIMVIIVGGIIFWVIYALRKIRKATKFWFKYKFFKKKHNEQDVALLMEFMDQGLSEVEMVKELFLKGHKRKVPELTYIFREMQGGNKK